MKRLKRREKMLILTAIFFTMLLAIWCWSAVYCKLTLSLEQQTWIKNASQIDNVPQAVCKMSYKYVRNLMDHGAQTRIFIYEQNSAPEREIQVIVKDQGPYWASARVWIHDIPHSYKISQIQVKDGVMTIALQQSYTLEILICIFGFVLYILGLVLIRLYR